MSLYGATAFILLNLYIYCLHTNHYKAGITQERTQKQEKSPINKEFNAIMEDRKLPGVVFACKSLEEDETGRVCFIPLPKYYFHFRSTLLIFKPEVSELLQSHGLGTKMPLTGFLGDIYFATLISAGVTLLSSWSSCLQLLDVCT